MKLMLFQQFLLQVLELILTNEVSGNLEIVLLTLTESSLN